MQRFGRIAKLRPVTDYDVWHAAVWPEVRAAIAAAGLRNYTIFRHGEWLFSYFELPTDLTLAEATVVIGQSSSCRHWEEQMRLFRDPEFSVDWLPMTEVFHQ